jgi:hypothetical protein
MALACVELAGRLHHQHIEELEAGTSLEKWRTSRIEVMGTFHEYSPIVAYSLPNRNPPRPSRPLHPPPRIDHRWPGPSPRIIHSHSHYPQPRSFRKQASPIHQLIA